MLLPRILLACLLLSLVAACGSEAGPDEDHDDHDPLARFAFYYQPISDPGDIAKLGDVTDVVTTSNEQLDPKVVAAFRAFRKSSGHDVKVYRYFQTYWYPSGRAIDGLDMAEHEDWAFCLSGSKPTVGKTVGGHDWMYLDFNEKAVRSFILKKLREFKALGYDGIFLDRGLAAFTGNTIGDHPEVWHHRSGCTEDPYLTDPDKDTFSDAFAAMLSLVHKADLKLVLNYGYSPRDPAFPLRPDPRDPACRQGKFSECRIIDGLGDSVDYFLDEAVTHPRDVRWEKDFAANLANEQDQAIGGRVVGLVTDGQLQHDTSEQAVYFAYARARLFDFPVTVFTGDDGCESITSHDLCNRAGIYPRLSSADFGRPRTDSPQSISCLRGSEEQCVWYRVYSGGVSIVNVTPQRQQVRIPMPAGCSQVTSLITGEAYKSGECTKELDVQLAPWSGLPLVFDAAP